MFEAQGTNLKQRSPNMAGVIMLVILLVSVGIAALIVESSKRESRQGEKIIAQIRSQSLAVYWRDHPAVQWYVRKGQTAGWQRELLGWRAIVKIAGDEGSYRGFNILFKVSKAGRIGQVEHWELNANATAGSYRSYNVVVGPDLRLTTPADTAIRLEGGKVYVNQVGYVSSSSEVSKNYLPEGVNNLAFYLAAKSGTKARFETVFNEMGPDPKSHKTHFGKVSVRKIAKKNNGWQVEVFSSSPRHTAVTVDFDENGLIIKQSYNGLEETVISQKELEELFPHAIEDFNHIMREAGLKSEE